MSKTAAAKNITSESFTCNHSTGEQATRYTATFACPCPACGDVHEHPGTGESARASRPSAGSYTIACSWCGHNFEGPAVAA